MLQPLKGSKTPASGSACSPWTRQASLGRNTTLDEAPTPRTTRHKPGRSYRVPCSSLLHPTLAVRRCATGAFDLQTERNRAVACTSLVRPFHLIATSLAKRNQVHIKMQLAQASQRCTVRLRKNISTTKTGIEATAQPSNRTTKCENVNELPSKKYEPPISAL